MTQYINIDSRLPADTITISILHYKYTTLLNTKQEKSIEFRLKQHNKGKIREVNHFFRQNTMKKVLNNNEIKR